jgi:hypothetical protein
MKQSSRRCDLVDRYLSLKVPEKGSGEAVIAVIT